MDKDFYKKMAQALSQMDEASKKKMDPVDQDELKGSHADRKDKDIDNDGDADKSDEYLHNRRKAVSKAIKGKGKAEVTMNTGTTGSKSGASMEQKESALPPVYSRILEKRDMHYKGAMKQQPMDDNLPGAGAKKMAADHKPDIDDKVNTAPDMAKKAGQAGPSAAKRPNDNTNGDKSVINPVKGMK